MTTTPIPGQVPCRPHPPTSAAKPTCPGQPDRADSRSPRGGALDRPAQRSYRYQPTPPARHAERGLIQPAICGVNSDTRHFYANAAWTVIACLAHNLLRWTELIGLPGGVTRAARSVRRRLLALPGRLTTHAGHWTLHLPARWPWQTDFTEALGRVRALPAA
jgi:hypothetical protein